MQKIISLEKARVYIEALDLTDIAESMCAASYPLPQWTKEDAAHCMRLYKNFLILFKMHLPKPLVPTKEIDEFWHNHILHTKRYINDCEAIFGYYLHHHPASIKDDPRDLIEPFLETKRLYQLAFGHSL